VEACVSANAAICSSNHSFAALVADDTCRIEALCRHEWLIEDGPDKRQSDEFWVKVRREFAAGDALGDRLDKRLAPLRGVAIQECSFDQRWHAARKKRVAHRFGNMP
jgi:hypothetical protein